MEEVDPSPMPRGRRLDVAPVDRAEASFALLVAAAVVGLFAAVALYAWFTRTDPFVAYLVSLLGGPSTLIVGACTLAVGGLVLRFIDR